MLVSDYKIVGLSTTNITSGTTADYAHEQYCEKQKKIHELEYECKLLIDKYIDEMRSARIPYFLSESYISSMFSSDNENKQHLAKSRATARKMFVENAFSPEFLLNNNVKIVDVMYHDYSKTAAEVIMEIGDWLYSVGIPFPANVRSDRDKLNCMGRIKFRADRMQKSKRNDLVQEWKAVQMPTYDWKKCFEAIEADVRKETNKDGE